MRFTSPPFRVVILFIDQNADVNVGEKMILSTNETDMFANSGDFMMKSAGNALLQGDKDARISRG